METKCV